GVVEDGAAVGASGIGAGQDVDPHPLLIGGVRPDALDDEDAALLPLAELRMQHDAALPVAEPDAVALGDTERGEVVGMDADHRPALARDAGGRIVEGRVEEGARGWR